MVVTEDRYAAGFGDYSPYAIDNFEFERVVKLERRSPYHGGYDTRS